MPEPQPALLICGTGEAPTPGCADRSRDRAPVSSRGLWDRDAALALRGKGAGGELRGARVLGGGASCWPRPRDSPPLPEAKSGCVLGTWGLGSPQEHPHLPLRVQCLCQLPR